MFRGKSCVRYRTYLECNYNAVYVSCFTCLSSAVFVISLRSAFFDIVSAVPAQWNLFYLWPCATLLSYLDRSAWQARSRPLTDRFHLLRHLLDSRGPRSDVLLMLRYSSWLCYLVLSCCFTCSTWTGVSWHRHSIAIVNAPWAFVNSFVCISWNASMIWISVWSHPDNSITRGTNFVD